MQRSVEHILTTHVGSLPRGETLNDLLIRHEGGEDVDRAELDAEIDRRVDYVFKKQLEIGIDVPNDGEQGRVGFQTYVAQRMKGFAGQSNRPRPKEFNDFPKFAEAMLARFPRRGKQFNAPQCVGDIEYVDLTDINAEVERLRRQADAAGKDPADCFMTAPSPGIIASTLLNAHYPSEEDYLFALAREMGKEYRAVAEGGLTLQIDAPDLAMDRHIMYQDKPEAEFVKIAEIHIEAINRGIEGIPPERVRLHCCWGNWDGPHIHDIPLASILPALTEARVGALSIEFSNPRHQHEYKALGEARLPDHLVILPGVIETTNNFVEHPEVVARRIAEAVAAVGDRERVIASTDCGFGTFAGREWVAEDVVWAKLASLRAGADLASGRLWGQSP
jgi:5-methyltetrahydropteroyltriglutamate--homocysteine methyltransferase